MGLTSVDNPQALTCMYEHAKNNGTQRLIEHKAEIDHRIIKPRQCMTCLNEVKKFEDHRSSSYNCKPHQCPACLKLFFNQRQDQGHPEEFVMEPSKVLLTDLPSASEVAIESDMLSIVACETARVCSARLVISIYTCIWAIMMPGKPANLLCSKRLKTVLSYAFIVGMILNQNNSSRCIIGRSFLNPVCIS